MRPAIDEIHRYRRDFGLMEAVFSSNRVGKYRWMLVQSDWRKLLLLKSPPDFLEQFLRALTIAGNVGLRES